MDEYQQRLQETLDELYAVRCDDGWSPEGTYYNEGGAEMSVRQIMQKLQGIIARAPGNKSSGRDGISYEYMKAAGPAYARQLAELADGFDEFGASGSEWRTPPLWGAEYVGHVLGVPETCTDPFSAELTPNYLHDGRARSLMEAILWHGGEANAARQRVVDMTEGERALLLRFLNSL